MLSRQQIGTRLLQRSVAAGQRGKASVAEPVEVASLPTLPPFDHIPQPYVGPTKDEVHQLRKKYLSPGAEYDAISLLNTTRNLNIIMQGIPHVVTLIAA